MRWTLALVLTSILACGGGAATAPDGAPLTAADAAPRIDAPPDVDACVPATCASLDLVCGTAADGCGGTLSCGTCVDVDVKTMTVSGTITANGAIPAQTCASPGDLRGEVIFIQEAGFASFRLPIPCAAADQPFTFAGEIFAGSYRVQVLGAASSLPNHSLTVATGLELTADRSGLSWDVTSRRVSGTVTQNGQIPAQTNCPTGLERGQLIFTEVFEGSQFTFPMPCDDPAVPYSFSGTVTPGVYDVRILGANSALPSSLYVVQRGLVVDHDRLDLSYDIVTVTVSGTVTLNGVVPGQAATCTTRRAQVELSGLRGASVLLPVPCAPAGTPFSFSGEVYPDSYRVAVAGLRGGELPTVPFRAADDFAISGPISDLAFDVRTFPVSGTVTIDGAPPPACTGATWGELTAESANPYYNFSIVVPCVAGGPFGFATALFPGTYDVWARINGGESLLVASDLVVDAPLAGVTLAATSTAPAHEISGTVTLNGGIPGTTCTAPDARALITLDELGRGASLDLFVPCAAPGEPFAFSGRVAPGTYRVTITGLTSDLPGVGYLANPSLVVAGPMSGLTFDVVTRRVGGTLTLGGATPACSARTGAKVNFVDEARNVSFVLDARCDETSGALRYEGDVYPGTYTVVVYGAASTLPSAGYLARSGLVIP